MPLGYDADRAHARHQRGRGRDGADALCSIPGARQRPTGSRRAGPHRPADKAEDRRGGRRTGGTPFSRGHLYRILSNPIYAGRITQGPALAASTRPSSTKSLGRGARTLAKNAMQARLKPTPKTPACLPASSTRQRETLIATHASKQGRRYRYYVERSLLTPETENRKTVEVVSRTEAERGFKPKAGAFPRMKSRSLYCSRSATSCETRSAYSKPFATNKNRPTLSLPSSCVHPS